MRYEGKFSDLNGKVYEVVIQTGSVTTKRNITFSGDPCTITMASKGLFDPIKSRKCTLEIVSDEYIMDLYQSSSRNASVYIKDTSDDSIIFRGYLTPNSYDQSYTHIDTIELEAVDAVSTLKDVRLPKNPASYIYRSFIDFVLSLLQDTACEIPNSGYRGYLYIPESYNTLNNQSVSDVLNMLYVSEANFYDDDEEHSPWTKYEILEEIMKFMGWTLVPFGDDVYIIDYRYINNYNSLSYQKYTISNGEHIAYTSTKQQIHITKDTNAAGGEPSFSLDDTYNKIELSDNLYKIDDIAPDLFDVDNLEDVTIPYWVNNEFWGYTNIMLNQTQWVKTTRTKHWFRPDEVSTDITGYEYQTVSLLKPETGWKHHFYKMNGLYEISHVGEEFPDYSNCYDRTSTSEYNRTDINKYINTVGCVLQRYAYRQNTGSQNLPTSLDWNNYLTFFITDDTTGGNGTYPLFETEQFELPVLEYQVSEQVMWKPSTGTSWITINGDLFYQYNNYKYGEDDKQTINTINTSKKIYTTAPIDKCSDVDEQKYCGVYWSYNNVNYGRGFSTWKMKLQIGNKFWNGTRWLEYNGDENNQPTFYINYDNNVSNRDDEYLPAFRWASVVPNTDYTDKVGENCYAIRIDANDSSAPAFGTLKLTIYAPRIFPVEYINLFSARYRADRIIDWKTLPNVIYCKDFELGYIYTDDSYWWSAQKDDDKSDIVYTNIINDAYTNEFNKIELKINTQLPNKPISRSYVCVTYQNGNKTYLKTLKHICGDGSKTQEKNIIDLYYYHHNEPKKKYGCYVHGLFQPDDIFTSAAITGRFMIDNYSFNVRDNKSSLSLIEY